MAARMLLKKLALLLPPVQRRYAFLRQLGAEHEANAIRLAEAHAHIEHLNRALSDSLTETGDVRREKDGLAAMRERVSDTQGLETRVYVLTSDLQRSIERNDRLHGQIHSTADLMRDLRAEVADLRREQAEVKGERDTYAAINQDLRAECEDQRTDMLRLEAAAAAASALGLRERVAELEILLIEADRRLEDEKAKTAFRDSVDQEEIEALRLRAYVLKSDLERATERNSLLTQELKALTQALEASTAKAEAAESRKAGAEGALQAAQAKLLEALERGAELDRGRHNIDAALSVAEAERQAAEARLRTLSQQLIDANAELSTTRSALSSSESRLNILTPEMADLRQNLIDLETALAASQAQLENRGAVQ
jgi:chemotaxis protein MotB